MVSFMFFAGVCDGRLLVYNVETGEVRTLLSNLCGANGVQLSLDEKSITVAETLKYRVRIIDTTSWKTTKLIHVPSNVIYYQIQNRLF